MATLREEIAPFIDENGQVLLQPNTAGAPETGDGIFLSAIYYLALIKTKQFKPEDALSFISMLMQCEVPGNPGLLHRAPEKTAEQISWDQYIAAIAGCAFIGTDYLRVRIRQQAARRYFGVVRFCFPNLNPPKLSSGKAWFGRNPWFTAFAKISLGMHYTWIAELVLAIRLVVSGKLQRPNAIVLDWLMVNAVRGRSLIVDWAISRWEKDLLLARENGISGALKDYCIGRSSDSHPFKHLGIIK